MAPISKTKAYTLVKIIEKAHGRIELKEDVNEVELPEKVGADEKAREEKAKAAEKVEKAEKADSSKKEEA